MGFKQRARTHGLSLHGSGENPVADSLKKNENLGSIKGGEFDFIIYY
jgi:hypothetical protein